MSAQMKPTLTERLKSLWDSYGIEVLKFGTVGGAAFIVNSVTVWVLMMTIMSESHTKAKVVASVVATIFSWLIEPSVDLPRLPLRKLEARSHRIWPGEPAWHPR